MIELSDSARVHLESLKETLDDRKAICGPCKPNSREDCPGWNWPDIVCPKPLKHHYEREGRFENLLKEFLKDERGGEILAERIMEMVIQKGGEAFGKFGETHDWKEYRELFMEWFGWDYYPTKEPDPWAWKEEKEDENRGS